MRLFQILWAAVYVVAGLIARYGADKPAHAGAPLGAAQAASLFGVGSMFLAGLAGITGRVRSAQHRTVALISFIGGCAVATILVWRDQQKKS